MSVCRLALTIGLLVALGAGSSVTVALSDPQAELLSSARIDTR